APSAHACHERLGHLRCVAPTTGRIGSVERLRENKPTATRPVASAMAHSRATNHVAWRARRRSAWPRCAEVNTDGACQTVIASIAWRSATNLTDGQGEQCYDSRERSRGAGGKISEIEMDNYVRHGEEFNRFAVCVGARSADFLPKKSPNGQSE